MSNIEIKHPGRVRNYIKRKYGNKAFTKDGKIKTKYLHEALKSCKDESLRRAIQLAINFRKMKT